MIGKILLSSKKGQRTEDICRQIDSVKRFNSELGWGVSVYKQRQFPKTSPSARLQSVNYILLSFPKHFSLTSEENFTELR